jgi:hypothetical protein
VGLHRRLRQHEVPGDLRVRPTPVGELPALAAGLVAFCWPAIALWTAPGEVGGAQEPARRDSTTVQA